MSSQNIWNFLEYIKSLNDGNDILLSSRFKSNNGEMITTKWTLSEQWKNQYKVIPNYRQVLKHELVLEKDYSKPEQNKKEADKIIQRLEEQNINYWSIFTGSKSYHIHIFVPELKELNSSLIPQTKSAIVKNLIGQDLYKGIDEANFHNSRLIQIELSVNPKTGKHSEPYKEKKDGGYPTLKSIEKKMREIKIKRSDVEYKDWQKDLCPKKCNALEYCFENNVFEEQSNKTRHHYIAPSLACYIRHKKDRDDLARKYYVAQEKPVGEIESWDKLQTYFSCKRIRQYFESIGKDEICIKCLLEGDLHG
jgi:hypothetical protein